MIHSDLTDQGIESPHAYERALKKPPRRATLVKQGAKAAPSGDDVTKSLGRRTTP